MMHEQEYSFEVLVVQGSECRRVGLCLKDNRLLSIQLVSGLNIRFYHIEIVSAQNQIQNAGFSKRYSLAVNYLETSYATTHTKSNDYADLAYRLLNYSWL
jgi:hypothetical protein